MQFLCASYYYRPGLSIFQSWDDRLGVNEYIFRHITFWIKHGKVEHGIIKVNGCKDYSGLFSQGHRKCLWFSRARKVICFQWDWELSVLIKTWCENFVLLGVGCLMTNDQFAVGTELKLNSYPFRKKGIWKYSQDEDLSELQKKKISPTIFSSTLASVLLWPARLAHKWSGGPLAGVYK